VFGLLIESESENLESQDANAKPLGNNNNGKPLAKGAAWTG